MASKTNDWMMLTLAMSGESIRQQEYALREMERVILYLIDNGNLAGTGKSRLEQEAMRKAIDLARERERYGALRSEFEG